MFRAVLKKEMLESIVTLKFLLISVLIVLSFAVSGFVSLKTYKQRVNDYLHGQEEYYRAYEGSMYLAREPKPLPFLATGLADMLDDTFTGVSAELEFRREAYSTYLDFVRYVGESADYSVEYDHTASIDMSEMPQLGYFPPSFPERVSFILFPLAILILGNVFLFFFLTYRSFLRSDISR